MLRCLFLVSSTLALAGCIHVKLDPVHVTVDVKIIDKALDDFFGDLDKKSTTITTPAAK